MKGKVVYLHRNASTGKIFYVGKGVNRGRAYSEYGRPKEWYDIVDKDFFDVEIIAHSISDKEAYDLETLTIETIGLDNLTNSTNGGLGCSGLVHSKETKKKISTSVKNRPKELVKEIAKKSANSRRANNKKLYKHIETGEVIRSLGLACEKYGITYKIEWQRQQRNSANKVFIEYNNDKID